MCCTGSAHGSNVNAGQTKPVCEMSGAGDDQKYKPYSTSIKISILSLMLKNIVYLKCRYLTSFHA